MALEGFAPIDFHAFHRDTLPERLAGSAGAAVSAGLGGLEALAFQLPSGDAYTYVPRDGTLVVKAGSEPATTVIEVQAAGWEGLVHDYESAAGLLYGNRARCLRGNAMRFIAWEPVLRALPAFSLIAFSSATSAAMCERTRPDSSRAVVSIARGRCVARLREKPKSKSRLFERAVTLRLFIC